ncbi:conserved putative membrane protein [Candidatus Protochlamydia naegleriophila]|uniref:Conserved putative membrane protein n=1 Tax=Candidatus Protochlamydia naegleriophila TaxID=389348 RepID=A0A0U5JAD3_9BACT|nr:hypothetical protein [Candidatus Protochlamydia naegleriophila]CUI15732.1 conserved putative membrane protein [Candidatus Protochlamydia naegleriophila]
MNTNDPKSSQDPTNPIARDPSNSAQPARPTQPNRSSSAEPGKVSPTNEAGKARTGEPNRVGSEYTQKEKDYYQKESVEDKVREHLRQARDSKKVDEIYDYARNNKEQTITYILLGIGLLLMLFVYESILGELLIGLVAGYHFAPEILFYLRNIGQVFTGQDQLRYIVLTAVLLGLFIAAPGIFIGSAIAASFKQVIQGFNDRGGKA